MFTIWPSTVWTSVAQPTEQKGQTLGVTFAFAIRSASVCATTGWRLTPDAIRPPSAVAPPPATEKRRSSRREISIAQTPFAYRHAARAGLRLARIDPDVQQNPPQPQTTMFTSTISLHAFR